MILIDSSAWIEFLRDSRSAVCDRVDALLDQDIATNDPIRMEILAGARDDTHLAQLRGLLARSTILPTERVDYERAALLYRQCRSNGETVRKLIDCLIAATAIRAEIPVLHLDRDFSILTRWTDLRVVTFD